MPGPIATGPEHGDQLTGCFDACRLRKTKKHDAGNRTQARAPGEIAEILVIRTSADALARTSRSGRPGVVPAMQATSCPALRKARTIAHGTFSSARNRAITRRWEKRVR